MQENELNPILTKILKIGMYISGLAIVAMMLLTTVDVTLKNIFNAPIPGSYLFVQNYLMPLAFFCGMPYAFFSGIFPRIDIFLNKLSKKTNLTIVITILIIEIASFIAITYYSLLYGIHGLTTKITFLAGINSIPLYPFFFLVTLGFGTLSIYLTITIIKIVKTNGEYTFFADSEEM